MTGTPPPVRPRVLASTTSHKREPLVPVLDVFRRLGLRDIDLNLHHILELGVPVSAVNDAVEAYDLRLWVLSGGWCDFFHDEREIERTFASIARQVLLADELGVLQLRLFFGRLHETDYSREMFDRVTGHLSRLSDSHAHMTFAFENHDGASLNPDICRDILDRVGRPNIVMNFDPINFAKVGVDPGRALEACRPFIGHVHLKGLENGHYCEFGEGDVDLAPIIDALETSGYTGAYTVEYEGPFDGTLRLYRSTERARKRLETRGRDDLRT
jgi:sugar phosphate isomerase/epimerase